MTIPDYLRHLRHPETIGDEEIAAVRDLADRFPYCSSSQILLAYRLFMDNDLDFPTQLKKAAAYASSRKKLKIILKNLQSMLDKIPLPATEVTAAEHTGYKKEEVSVIPAEAPAESPGEIFDYSPVTETEYQIPETTDREMTREEELLAIVRHRLAEITQQREKEIVADEEETHSGPDEGKKELTRSELIDRFLHDKPRLSPPKAAFFSPSEKAIKSNLDDEEIVTETLALLYSRQGNIGKAVKIYDKLILLYPEKSSYFAAQIKIITSTSE
jgi:hypothetical protein